MAPRLDLQALLIDVLGSNKVYFQPPATMQIEYPCIVYKRDSMQTSFADDKPYTVRKRYQLTFITRDPDSVIVDKIAQLPKCVHDRFYTADNLNHDTFRIFF